MFKLTRAFVIAAAVTSSALCAPFPQDVGKPISSGSRPTGPCVVPALAKDAGMPRGQDQLIVQQAIQLCDASTVAVSSKNSKQGMKAPNVALPAPFSSSEPHPVRAADERPPNAEVPPKPSSEPLPGGPQPHVARDLSPQPKVTPSPIPKPHTPHPMNARSAPKAEVPAHAQPLPATLPRPSQPI